MELLQVGRQSGPTRWKVLQVIRLDLGDLLGFLDGTAAGREVGSHEILSWLQSWGCCRFRVRIMWENSLASSIWS